MHRPRGQQSVSSSANHLTRLGARGAAGAWTSFPGTNSATSDFLAEPLLFSNLHISVTTTRRHGAISALRLARYLFPTHQQCRETLATIDTTSSTFFRLNRTRAKRFFRVLHLIGSSSKAASGRREGTSRSTLLQENSSGTQQAVVDLGRVRAVGITSSFLPCL